MPEIANRHPGPGDGGVDGTQSILFGVRDTDSRAVLASVQASLLLPRVMYEGDALPSRDPAIKRGEGYAYEGRFSDAVPVPPTGAPAQFTLVSDGLQIQKTSGSDQESFVFVTDRLVPEAISGIEIEIEVLQHTAATPSGVTSFYDGPYFTGIVVGLINWRYRTGLFLLLMDDGEGKSILLTGPAMSASGGRVVFGGVPVDWSAGPIRFRLAWDDTPGNRDLYAMFEVNGEQNGGMFGAEAVSMLEGAPFMPGLRIGGIDTSRESQNAIMAVVGTAGPTAGDAIVVRSLSVAGFGVPLVIRGGPTAHADLVLSGNAVDPLRVGEQAWTPQGAGLRFVEEGTNVIVAASDASGAFVSLAEPDLSARSWLLVANFSVPTHTSLPGLPRTGPEFHVHDGSSEFVVGCVDDGGTTGIGFLLGPGTNIRDYVVGSPVDWSSPTALMVSGSVANGFRVEVNDVAYATAPYGDLPVGSSAESKISVGWASAAGLMHISGLWLLPNALCAEPGLGTLPDDQGWSVTVQGGANVEISAGRYLISADTAEGRFAFSVGPGDYESWAGGAWHIRCRPLSWADQYGAPSPTNVEIGPVALTQFETNKAIGLSFVEVEGGRLFAFIRGEDEDLRSVIAQNRHGVAISTEVSAADLTTYVLEVIPGKHVRLYVNYGATPAIDIPWVRVVHRPSPAGLPGGTAGAFGSVGVSGGVRLDVAFARFGYGRGYDFFLTPNFTEEERVAWTYDGTGAVYVIAGSL